MQGRIPSRLLRAALDAKLRQVCKETRFKGFEHLLNGDTSIHVYHFEKDDMMVNLDTGEIWWAKDRDPGKARTKGIILDVQRGDSSPETGLAVEAAKQEHLGVGVLGERT